MLLVAQRVVSRSGDHGINAYYYSHGDRTWIDPPAADALEHGRRLNEIVEVRGAGNRVRSYLDVLAPDATPNSRIVEDVLGSADFLGGAKRKLPWSIAVSDIRFTFQAERALAQRWDDELRTLLTYALQVRPNAPDEGGGVLGGRLGIFSGRHR